MAMLACLRSTYFRVPSIFGLVRGQQTLSVRKPGGCDVPFDNLALRRLPVEQPYGRSSAHHLVENACFIRLPDPETVRSPCLVASSADVLQMMHIDKETMTEEELAEHFSGNRLFAGAEPAGHSYCGYQYGLFTGQLGDGAVMYLGEVVSPDGERNEVQLKGAGKTPFSRVSTDGRKVLRSSIRELLAAEAMAYLGIPTSRVATCVTSDTDVYRDIMYTGEITAEKATVVCRLAPTFLRIGSLEVALGTDPVTGKAGPSPGNVSLQRDILHHLIYTYYPQLYKKDNEEQMYGAWFQELLKRSAELVAQWQAIGFCHGVLNTDNISLVGVTIDYGPFAFLDHYDPDFICNASDHWARFSYSKQPEMMRWCFERLAETLSELVPTEITKRHLKDFDTYYQHAYINIMRAKLGLKTSGDHDRYLIGDLLRVMQLTGTDYSKTLRSLSGLHHPRSSGHSDALWWTRDRLLALSCSARRLRQIYGHRVAPSQEEIVRSLWVLQSNPELIPLYTEAAAAAAEQLNARPLVTEVQALSERTKRERDRLLWGEWLERYSRHLLEEAEGMPHDEEEDMERRAAMDRLNPRFVLKNHVIQRAIEDAEFGNYATTRALMELVKKPFDEHPEYSVAEHRDSAESLLRVYDGDQPENPLQIT